jgi:hypothetical protein
MTSVICGVVYAISLVITSRKATKRVALQTTS